MKHIQLFETIKYRKPGLRNSNIGRFLVGVFFKNKKYHSQEEQPYEVIESEDGNGYRIEFCFNDLNGSYFDTIIELKNFLMSNYNMQSYDMNITKNYNSNEYNSVILSVLVKNSNSIEKLKADAKQYAVTKNYNL